VSLLAVLVSAMAMAMATPIMSAHAAAARTVRVSSHGVRATLPAGWRLCRYGRLEHVARCRNTNVLALETGGMQVTGWAARFRGDTCLAQQFTNGRPGPRIKVPATVKGAFKRHGWQVPVANRTVQVNQGTGRRYLLYVLCARTGDNRVVTMSFTGPTSRGSAVLTRALWSASRTATLARTRVYLPGTLGLQVRPHQVNLNGDGNGVDTLAGLSWSRWTSRVADGRGTEELDRCGSACGSGSGVKFYPVTVHAYAPKFLECAMFFSKVTLTYTAGVPSGDGRTFTYTFPVWNQNAMSTLGSCP